MKMQTMTVDEVTVPENIELDVLKKENEELKARCAAYEEKLRNVRDIEEHAYMRGKIDGLEFSIRCNGVSRDEVKR